jgi:hypothetical protein
MIILWKVPIQLINGVSTPNAAKPLNETIWTAMTPFFARKQVGSTARESSTWDFKHQLFPIADVRKSQ